MDRIQKQEVLTEASQHRMVLRVKHKFRQRNIEWLASIQMFLLGWILLDSAPTFSTSGAFLAMATWGQEESWGWFLMMIGASGLIGLVINGSMESVTPWIRVGRAVLGCIAFSMIATSMFISWLVYGNPPSTGIAMYLPSASFEVAAIYTAIIDARVYRNGRRTRAGY